MIAILSDIHGNLEALEAVLADMERNRVEDIYCLGDLIGYGPDPLPCIERAMSWKLALQSHFDKSSLGNDDLPGFVGARHARKTILRFREQLKFHPNRDVIQRFMSERPEGFANPDAQFVHGTLRDPLNEYLFPEAIYDQARLNEIGARIDKLCFCGHSHIAGIFTSSKNGWDYRPQSNLNCAYSIGESKTICNVGSVGQPRDEDVRACYVLWGNNKIDFRRVPYDIEKTIAKIKANADEDVDGDRYRFGR